MGVFEFKDNFSYPTRPDVLIAGGGGGGGDRKYPLTIIYQFTS